MRLIWMASWRASSRTADRCLVSSVRASLANGGETDCSRGFVVGAADHVDGAGLVFAHVVGFGGIE
jgi:hypothetical protein